MVGTALAFWMRSVLACATCGARLAPSAPSVPRAAPVPPESLMKSRREKDALGESCDVAGRGGATTLAESAAAIVVSSMGVSLVSLIEIVQWPRRLVNIVNMNGLTNVSGPGGQVRVYGGLYCVGARRRRSAQPHTEEPEMFKKSEEQEWTRFRGA